MEENILDVIFITKDSKNFVENNEEYEISVYSLYSLKNND